MTSYGLGYDYSLRTKKRRYPMFSDNPELEEEGFLKKHRFSNRQRKSRVSLNGYESDSYDENDSDYEESYKKCEEEAKDPSGDDIFTYDGGMDKSIREPQDQPKDKLDYEDPKFADDAFEDSHKEDGITFEAFNVKEENKHGFFDINGNYIRAQDDNEDRPEDQDQWIEDVKDVDKVAESQRRNEAMRRRRQRELQNRGRHYMADEALIRLTYFVNPHETVLTTLGRLNKLRSAGDPEKYIVNAINFVTELIDILENKGIKDVYGLTRQDLAKLVKEESLGESSVTDNYKTKLWSFKWIQKMDLSHGLYTNYEMQYWKCTYFNHKVIVKFCHEPDEAVNWVHIDCLDFM